MSSSSSSSSSSSTSSSSSSHSPSQSPPPPTSTSTATTSTATTPTDWDAPLSAALHLPGSDSTSPREPSPGRVHAVWAEDSELDLLITYSKAPCSLLRGPAHSPPTVSKDLKAALRTGLPLWLRGLVWALLSSGGTRASASPHGFAAALTRVFGVASIDAVPSPLHNVPSFSAVGLEDTIGVPDSLPSAVLEAHEVREANIVLILLATENPDLSFVPALPELVACLVLFMDPATAFWTVTGMIEESRTRGWYFPLSRSALALFVETFASLAKSKAKGAVSALAAHDLAVSDVAIPWFRSLFLGHLPLYAVVTLMDAYMNEGSKILYRVGLALLRALTPALKTASSQEDALSILGTAVWELGNDRDAFHAMLKAGYKIHLQRKKFAKLTSAHAAAGVDESSYGQAVLYYRPDLQPASDLVPYESLSLLWYTLPSRYRIHGARRVFASGEDGYSLALARARVIDAADQIGDATAPILMLFSLNPGAVVGAYLSRGFASPSVLEDATRDSGGLPSWEGNGETFVFLLQDPGSLYDGKAIEQDPSAAAGTPVQTYTWDPAGPASGRKAFYRFFDDPESGDLALAVGESPTGRALAISSDFGSLATGPSTTFNSPPLLPSTLTRTVSSGVRETELDLGSVQSIEVYMLILA